MTAALPSGLRAATGLLAVVLLAAGCGSSSTASNAAPNTGDTASAPATGGTPGTETPTPEVSITPSSDVQGSTDLTSWLTQVCTAANNTITAGDFTPDLSKITKDPQQAMQNLVDTYTKLGAKMTSMADQLEQIGAPDIPNGKQFTDTYVDALRQLGATFSKIAEQVPTNATSPQQVMAAFKKLDTPQLQAQLKRLEASYKLIDTDQIEQLGKTIPECKKLDFGD